MQDEQEKSTNEVHTQNNFIEDQLSANIEKAIDNKLNIFLQKVESIQNERNKNLLKLIEEHSTKINVEKLIRDFINYGEIDNLVNYDFIKNLRVKRQLSIDNILMEKHRLGLIEGVPNFNEFCKYAHSQFEELLNHYYTWKYKNDVSQFNEYVNSIRTESNYINEGNYKSISKCTFSQKNLIFNIEKKINITDPKSENGRYGSIRLKVTKLRNQLSHRDSSIITQEDDVLRTFRVNSKKYKEVKELIKLHRKEELKDKNLKADEIVRLLKDNSKITEDDLKAYNETKSIEQDFYQIEFIRTEDWSEIRHSLLNLVDFFRPLPIVNSPSLPNPK